MVTRQKKTNIKGTSMINLFLSTFPKKYRNIYKLEIEKTIASALAIFTAIALLITYYHVSTYVPFVDWGREKRCNGYWQKSLPYDGPITTTPNKLVHFCLVGVRGRSVTSPNTSHYK